MPLELVVPPDAGEPEEDVREHRAPGRDRRVLQVLRARDARVALRGREEEAAVLLVGEELDREQGEPACLEQPPKLAGRDMQLEQTVGDVRVVVEEAGSARAAVADRAEEPPVLRGQRPEQEFSEPARGVEPVGSLEPVARLGERREREPVPRRERLVVTKRLRPREPRREHASPELRVQLAADDEAPVLEGLEEIAREADLDGLLRRPRVREALDAVRVSVLSGGEAAAGERQLPQ